MSSSFDRPLSTYYFATALTKTEPSSANSFSALESPCWMRSIRRKASSLSMIGFFSLFVVELLFIMSLMFLVVARNLPCFSEIKKSDHRKSTKNQLFVAIISYSKIVQGECRTSSLLERYAEPQPILFKDTANERHENLFSDNRVQPILFKDSANRAQ